MNSLAQETSGGRAATRERPISRAAIHRAKVALLTDEERADIRLDSAWIAGAKHGWNCGVYENSKRLNDAIERRISDRVALMAEAALRTQPTPSEAARTPAEGLG